MFNRKECSRCGKKISDSYAFCPHCGGSFNKNSQQDFGMLGNKDEMEEFDQFTNSIMGGFGGGILNKMLKNTMKMLEKEMQKEMKNNQPKSNMQLFINGKRVNVSNQPNQKPVQKEKKQNIKSIHFSESNQKKFTSLPQEEPKTKIKRLSDKILYELEVPQTKSIKDVSIVKLENSIEIKAITKNKAYFKSIPISLVLISYELGNDKLILEFESKD